MGRWTPDARGRLAQAAIELYAERGYEGTTVADIAERAGVTERTFFRHYADKREVLFAGSSAMQEAVLAAIAAAPRDAPPFAVAADGMRAAAALIDSGGGDFPRRRSAVIAANPSLQERELLKLASLASASGEALRARGVAEPAASLAGQAAVGAFHVGFAQWIAGPVDATLASHVDAALRVLPTLA
ncbi:TetR/AcrR family transcriptional regulator [Leifsonia shinshuensis]|uniref:helix-turn-helix domain-containing protein n=1 Tax=Leifsonia shinshuensis TaxID=150026 RepID=UPI001F5096C0|nr:helix-turn-helix domain-containing protein [Leifsonia shinshuensis]MCI0157027.1 TetR/AcrR family transcriptional regulator [Leifsonia shinshuensis]